MKSSKDFIGRFICFAAAGLAAGCTTELAHQEMNAAGMPFTYVAPDNADVSHERFRHPRIGTNFYVTEIATPDELTLIAMIDTPAHRVLVKGSPAADADVFFHESSVSWTGPQTTRSTGLGRVEVQPYRLDNDQASCVAVQSFRDRTFDDTTRELYHESLIAIRCQEGTAPVSDDSLNDLTTRLVAPGF